MNKRRETRQIGQIVRLTNERWKEFGERGGATCCTAIVNKKIWEDACGEGEARKTSRLLACEQDRVAQAGRKLSSPFQSFIIFPYFVKTFQREPRLCSLSLPLSFINSATRYSIPWYLRGNTTIKLGYISPLQSIE